MLSSGWFDRRPRKPLHAPPHHPVQVGPQYAPKYLDGTWSTTYHDLLYDATDRAISGGAQ